MQDKKTKRTIINVEMHNYMYLLHMLIVQVPKCRSLCVMQITCTGKYYWRHLKSQWLWKSKHYWVICSSMMLAYITYRHISTEYVVIFTSWLGAYDFRIESGATVAIMCTLLHYKHSIFCGLVSWVVSWVYWYHFELV